MTLEKYLPKVIVVERKDGSKEAMVYPDITNKFLLENASRKISIKDARQQSKIVCQYQEPCTDKEDQFFTLEGNGVRSKGECENEAVLFRRFG